MTQYSAGPAGAGWDNAASGSVRPDPAGSGGSSPAGARPDGGRGRARTAVLLLLAAAVVSGVSFMVRWNLPESVAMPDSYWYTKYALLYAGYGEDAAVAGASDVVCAAQNQAAVRGGDSPTCRHYEPRITEPRYERIFASRPGYPMLAAPFVWAFGPWAGMTAVSVTLGVIAGTLVYLVCRDLGAGSLGGLAGSVLLYALPSGFWITRMLAELPVVVGYLITLLGVARLWGQRSCGVPLVGAGLAVTVLCKSSNGVVLALALAGASLAAALVRAPVRRSRLAVSAGFGILTCVVWGAVSRIWGLPSLDATIQDLASNHFREPGTAHPIQWLLAANAEFWPRFLGELVLAPWPVLFFVVGTVGIWRRAAATAWAWGLVGASGLLLLAGHPDLHQAGRLTLTFWLPAAVGLALLLHCVRLPRRWSASPSMSSPAGGCGPLWRRRRRTK